MATQTYLPMLDTSFYDANKGDGTYVPIDWTKAKTKWLGAIIKAGEGNYVDPAYDEQALAAKQAGTMWGAYYLYRTYYSAINAANLFCNQIEKYGGWPQLGVWLDVEYNDNAYSGTAYLAAMGSWLYEVEKRMAMAGAKVPVGIYTRNSFIDPLWINAGRPTWTKAYPYFQAIYQYNGLGFATMYDQIVHQNFLPPQPVASEALGPCAIHQWTDKGKPVDVPGYPPYKLSVDFSVVYRKFWQDTVFTPPPPTAPPPLLMKCVTSSLNIRSGPGSTFADVGDLLLGEVVVVDNVDGLSGPWVHFALPGRTGWALARSNTGAYYLKKL